MPSARIRVLTRFAIAAVAAAGILAVLLIKRGSPGADEQPARRQLLIAGADVGYVDSSTCAGCHRKIWETYKQTGMGRSLSRVRPDVLGGDFSANNTFYHPASDRHYTMQSRDGKYFQRRHQKGFDGKDENVVEKEVHYVAGSGNHARTYLHLTPEGKLFELPVAWYSENGGHWGMNPGFDHARHPDFRRQLLFECVACHTGYPKIETGADASGREPLFPAGLPEGIDCQRCHGPGRKHIEAAAGGKLEDIRSAIVNPKRLPRERQLEVCLQCHLETTSSRLPHTILRFERGALSYRPGSPLADFAIHFDHQAGQGYDDKFEIAHQAYRLRKSACFLKSDGRMTCTTCHDPHAEVRGEAAIQRYANACRGCHTTPHTSAANCIECHMPKRRPQDVVNVVMTDHYIQRRAPGYQLAAPLKERQETEETRYQGAVALYYPAQLSAQPDDQLYLAVAQVKQFNNLKEGIRRLEAALKTSPQAAGEFYLELAEAYGKAGRNEEAIRAYREAVLRKPGLRPAWLGLGRSLSKSGQHREAVETLRKAAAMGIADATILNDLGLAYLSAGQRAEAVRVLGEAVGIDPEHPEAQHNLGNALRESGDVTGAEQAYRNAIRPQPDLANARQGLADLLTTRGFSAEAEYHYRKAMSQEPESAAIRAAYATALASAERYDQALEHFQAAIRLDPKVAATHLGLADMLAVRGRMNQAIGHYQQALAIEPDLGGAHLGLGSALESKGRRAEAIQHLQKAAQSSDSTTAQAAREALQSVTTTGAAR